MLTVGGYRAPMSSQDAVQLRQCVLAVSVLRDLDLTPSDRGVVLPGARGLTVPWAAVAQAVGSFPVDGPIARRRVEMLLRLHQLALDLGSDAAAHMQSAARLVALPPGHAEDPGAGWPREVLRGGALELGIGVHGLLNERDRTVPLPPSVLTAIGVPAGRWWPRLREHTERMGALCAARLSRDGPTGVIRPVGGCDVLALLASRTLRRHLADADGVGMRALAVPTRRRGWFDAKSVDPAFVQAAWSLTDEHERGLPLPLLVTADDVALPFTLA
jgi:hypothetical protein